MYLEYFCKDLSFPFLIQHGQHEEDMFIHTHADFSELVIVVSGSAIHVVGKESFAIQKGDVFVINRGTSHGYINAEGFQICNIMFRPEDLFQEPFAFNASEGFQALFVVEPYLTKKNQFKSRLTLDVKEFEVVYDIIEQMQKEYDQALVGNQVALRSMFYLLIVKLSRIYTFPDKIKGFQAINIAKSVSFIEQHYSNKLTLKQLAKISYMSERNFSRVFVNAYGMTPFTYITNVRLTNAKRLLQTSNLSISLISEQCGFTENSFFTRCFHKKYGLSPSQYRKAKCE